MNNGEKLVRLLTAKWIELKSNGERKDNLISELNNSDKLIYILSKSSSGNDILYVEIYSPNRVEYSINLNELIK